MSVPAGVFSGTERRTVAGLKTGALLDCAEAGSPESSSAARTSATSGSVTANRSDHRGNQLVRNSKPSLMGR